MNQHSTLIESGIDLSQELRAAIAVEDAERLDALFKQLPLSEALRELLELSSVDRRAVLTLISPEIAADLIEEAPHEIGADLMEDLETDRAVEIMDELDSDVQADLIGDMGSEEAEAILEQMDAEDAADVRRLSVRPKDALKVWLKEISVGVINGIALGILIGIVAWLWKGSPALGLVIGAALALNTMLAVSIGGVVPLLLKRIGQDPAVASGPLLTTVTDMAGFFFVLSLATVMMPWLI
ncbi:magnesium transporter [Yoonia maritima]|uniref:magnesium transporter n=1 Tax=Yoonia maritima TaxID=1435347 RepID=UPI000D103446|nr:magnesium transporter [Yoonia maritima]